MRILLISDWFPYPLDNGARLRIFNLLRRIARRHEIDLVSFIQNDTVAKEDLETVGSFCRILGLVPRDRFNPSRSQSIFQLLSLKPRSLVEMFNQQMAELLRNTVQTQKYDLILAAEVGPGMGVAPYLKDLDSIPRVIEDLELSMIRNGIFMQRSRMGRLRHYLTWWKHKHFARHLLKNIDGCSVPSDQEASLLRSLLPDFKPLAVVPNALDLDSYAGNWGSPVDGNLIFPGALTYNANFTAMHFFLRDIWPGILSEQPDAILRITGRTDEVPLEQLALTESVILTGYVSDIRPVIAQSQICIVPLLTGGGTRLKILESMALGTPVVSTSRGAEGLEVQSGRHVLIADKPADITAAVLSLLNDKNLRDELAANGKALVRERYCWKKSADRLEHLIRLVAETGKHKK